MWIKICGITSLSDAETAIAAGADAIGFVFAESPRRVLPESAGDIIGVLPESVQKIGVFVDTSVEEMAEVYRIAGLTGVQLHGSGGKIASRDLREHIGDSAQVLQVVRYDPDRERFAEELRRQHEWSDGKRNAVLVDTRVPGKQGGTGRTFDWLAARETFLSEAPHLRLIAAGGLNPENVRDAILTLQPWGVDVSSGVECYPGKKHADMVTAFIRAARATEMEIAGTSQA